MPVECNEHTWEIFSTLCWKVVAVVQVCYAELLLLKEILLFHSRHVFLPGSICCAKLELPLVDSQSNFIILSIPKLIKYRVIDLPEYCFSLLCRSPRAVFVVGEKTVVLRRLAASESQTGAYIKINLLTFAATVGREKRVVLQGQLQLACIYTYILHCTGI